jgi:hypothetical protein
LSVAEATAAFTTDSQYIYWGSRDVNAIDRANLAGTGINATWVATTGGTGGVALDAG